MYSNNSESSEDKRTEFLNFLPYGATWDTQGLLSAAWPPIFLLLLNILAAEASPSRLHPG